MYGACIENVNKNIGHRVALELLSENLKSNHRPKHKRYP